MYGPDVPGSAAAASADAPSFGHGDAADTLPCASVASADVKENSAGVPTFGEIVGEGVVRDSSAAAPAVEDELNLAASVDKVQEVMEQIAEFLVKFKRARARAARQPAAQRQAPTKELEEMREMEAKRRRKHWGLSTSPWRTTQDRAEAPLGWAAERLWREGLLKSLGIATAWSSAGTLPGWGSGLPSLSEGAAPPAEAAGGQAEAGRSKTLTFQAPPGCDSGYSDTAFTSVTDVTHVADAVIDPIDIVTEDADLSSGARAAGLPSGALGVAAAAALGAALLGAAPPGAALGPSAAGASLASAGRWPRWARRAAGSGVLAEQARAEQSTAEGRLARARAAARGREAPSPTPAAALPRVRVEDDAEYGRRLVVDETFASAWHPDRVITLCVWDALAAPTPGLERSDALIVGVELDTQVVEVASAGFGLDSLGLEVVVADALEVLHAERRSFDLIIEDVFMSVGVDIEKPGWLPMPGHELAQTRPVPGGLLVSNTINEGEQVRRSLRKQFSGLVQISVQDYENRIFVAGPGTLSGKRLRREVARCPTLAPSLKVLKFRSLGRGRD
ncbi:unnamed protein product [Prorocentrum cordatum]|uniref:Uncharacterized protein n=1 Tax=Prorocentrum cordatum TaxID=2364126 RepID=A0ABN9R1X2_9DINO|nr:unnamed protein product [Polarella glacialis]